MSTNGATDYAEKPWARSADKRGKEAALPLWVRALDAWADTRWPLGTPGRSAVREVVQQVERHVQHEIRAAKRRRHDERR